METEVDQVTQMSKPDCQGVRDLQKDMIKSSEIRDSDIW